MHSIIKHPLIGFGIAALGGVVGHFNHYSNSIWYEIEKICEILGPTYCIVSFFVILAGTTVKYLGRRTAAREFIELKEFLDKGLITEEEYEKKVIGLKEKLL